MFLKTPSQHNHSRSAQYAPRQKAIPYRFNWSIDGSDAVYDPEADEENDLVERAATADIGILGCKIVQPEQFSLHDLGVIIEIAAGAVVVATVYLARTASCGASPALARPTP